MSVECVQGVSLFQGVAAGQHSSSRGEVCELVCVLCRVCLCRVWRCIGCVKVQGDPTSQSPGKHWLSPAPLPGAGGTKAKGAHLCP